MTPFERQLDSAIAVHSSELVPCNAYVRFLLDVLQQQPFSPAYDMHPSPDTVSVRDQLLELPSAHQTNVLVRILQILKIVLRESSNRQVLQRADLAAIAEHMRLGVTPQVTVESSKVLLNCCFEPVNVMRLIDSQNLNTLCSILTGTYDDAAKLAVAGIVQSIGLQAKGRDAVRGSNVVPALVSVLHTGSMQAQAGAAGALANLSCDSQSVRLIRRSSGILPLLDLVQCRSSKQATARSAAAAIRNLSCEAASRRSIRDYQGVAKLLSLLGCSDLEASICASEALLNILNPGIARRCVGAPDLQEAIHRLLLCTLVLSMTGHSMQHL